ncbi:MAG: glycosyltransferase family 4 protein [Anaerolineae bacterium]|nr:glycosyltransferase family 4 protein [Anaerolineae bacterium]
MRVLLIMTAREIGGAENYVLHLVRALHSRVQFTVVLADHPKIRPLAAQLEQAARVWALPFDKPLQLPRIVALLRRLARAHDVVHINSNHPGSRLGIATALALRGQPTPIVCVEHRVSPISDIVVPSLLRPILPYLFRYSRRHVAKLVAVSQQNAQVLKALYGIPTEKIAVIHNGVPLSSASDQELARMRSKVRAELSVSSAEKLILTVARLSPNKGVEFLIRAMPSVLAARPDTYLAIAGAGEEREHLEQVANALALRNHVHFLGFRSDIPALLAASDLFVLPSLEEGLPLALLEAMSSGVVPICTAVGGIPEVVQDGISGLLVPPSSSQALAEAILRALSMDEAAHNQMRCAVRERARLFSAEGMADRTLELYRALGATRYNQRGLE